MKKLKAFVIVVIVGLALVPVALTQQKSEAPTPFRPKYDREIFKKSGTSIARGDLLACRNDDAQITDGGDVDIDEFARMLHGVWVNQNMRTIHGVTVETDNAFYVDMRGREGVAVMIDRNNLGDFSLSKPYLTPGSSLRNVARPLTLTQVSCTYEFVDRYIKVSDEVPVEVLGASTHVKFPRGATLEQAWKLIVDSGYFETFEMATQNREAGSPRRTVNMARLGDGQRLAILPDGTRVDEKGIREGLVPGAEYSLPMMVGGFFKITLSPVSEGREHVGVYMRWDAEYRATGVGLSPGEPLVGIEDGIFAREGTSYVAARRSVPSATGNALAFEDDGWLSEEGGDKNALVAAEGSFSARRKLGSTSSGLYFDRMVIGSPALDVLEKRGFIRRPKGTAPSKKMTASPVKAVGKRQHGRKR